MSTIPSLALIPSGVKASKVYSVLPTDGSGDFDFTRSGNATRVNSEGLIELVSTNVPRLNYPLIDGVVQGCPSLLLEPERINNLQRSEEFENAYWVNNGVTITANEIISPSGLLNADLLTGVSGGFGIVRFSTWTATNKVASCFAKAGATNIFKIANVSASNRYVLFDLSNGTVFEQSSGWTGFIENYGNGWYRCTAISNNETGTFSLGVTAASESVYIWGAQLEAGTYSTSYIPTTTTIATRSVENFTKTGLSNYINSQEGILYLEMAALVNSETGSNRAITINGIGGSVTDLISIRFEPTLNTIIAIFSKTGETTLTITRVLTDVTDFNKIAFSWKQDEFNLWANGVKIGSLTSGNTFSAGLLDAINSNIGNGSQRYSGEIKDLRVYSTVLNDTELALLTSL